MAGRFCNATFTSRAGTAAPKLIALNVLRAQTRSLVSCLILQEKLSLHGIAQRKTLPIEGTLKRRRERSSDPHSELNRLISGIPS
jgi:hypothetical protein